jgi:hypothetical protein
MWPPVPLELFDPGGQALNSSQWLAMTHRAASGPPRRLARALIPNQDHIETDPEATCTSILAPALTPARTASCSTTPT